GKVEALGLKYIRPTSKDDGYKEDLIASSEIEEKKEKLVQNLKKTVIDKIRAESSFKKTDKSWKCSSCSFSFLCDEEGEDGNEE
ncbi:MAG: hypothetical protein PHC34_12340, partial [Candidatus Gastranaerophilales bacterium]|nr:hypothetical protein [Candidatus Gastranaerophilales bacterium]